MDQRDAGAVGPLRDDLVPQHRSGRRAAELLDVGAAQPAREHAQRTVGRGRIREPGVSVCVEHDRAHGRIVRTPKPGSLAVR